MDGGGRIVSCLDTDCDPAFQTNKQPASLSSVFPLFALLARFLSPPPPLQNLRPQESAPEQQEVVGAVPEDGEAVGPRAHLHPAPARRQLVQQGHGPDREAADGTYMDVRL